MAIQKKFIIKEKHKAHKQKTTQKIPTTFPKRYNVFAIPIYLFLYIFSTYKNDIQNTIQKKQYTNTKTQYKSQNFFINFLFLTNAKNG